MVESDRKRSQRRPPTGRAALAQVLLPSRISHRGGQYQLSGQWQAAIISARSRMRVSSRIVARAVAADVTRRKCFSCQNPPLYLGGYLLELTLRCEHSGPPGGDNSAANG